MNKFWNWVRNSDESRTLYLNGTIAEESWFDDDITPAAFKAELLAGEGDITVWINSPGGDCVAASQIYSMLMDYKGAVTVFQSTPPLWVETANLYSDTQYFPYRFGEIHNFALYTSYLLRFTLPWCGFAGHFLVRSSRKFYDCLGFAMNVQINICTFIVP